MAMKKKANIGTGTIIGLIMGMIFLTILLSVAKDTIPSAAEAYYDLATDASSGLANTTIYGADAAQFATDSAGYMGWFWVIGPFALVVVLVMSLFRSRR